MAQKERIKAGDVFELNCGVSVTVLEYVGATKILIGDKQGNTKYCSADSLRRGCVSFVVDGVKKTKSVNRNVPKIEINVGDKFGSKSWGFAEVVEKINADRFLVKFENTGYIANVSRTPLLSGLIRDRTAFNLNIVKKIPVGSTYSTEIWGNFTVVKIVSCKEIYVQWEDTGEIQKTESKYILEGSVKDNSRRYLKKNYLNPKGYYVYIASDAEEVCYIGFGKSTRYLHCNSGISSNYLLNKRHFEGRQFSIEIYKDCMNKIEAEQLEKELIKIMKPTCNVQNTKS